MRFLDAQIGSIDHQTCLNIDLWISDDASTDGTRAYLDQLGPAWSRGALEILSGPATGHAAENFRTLITKVRSNADYFAYCDQDDVWLPTKLEKAIHRLQEAAPSRPALYCTRTALIDEDGKPIGQSTYFERGADFRHALVQSLAGGNTMVMNRAAFEIVQRSCERTELVSHDWWTYMILAGAGGLIIYDREPDTLYRQHSANVIGSNQSMRAKFVRLLALGRGEYKSWNDQNISGLMLCRDLLSAEALRALDAFRQARDGQLWQRLARLRASGVFRQTLGGQVMLYVASALGKV